MNTEIVVIIILLSLVLSIISIVLLFFHAKNKMIAELLIKGKSAVEIQAVLRETSSVQDLIFQLNANKYELIQRNDS